MECSGSIIRTWLRNGRGISTSLSKISYQCCLWPQTCQGLEEWVSFSHRSSGNVRHSLTLNRLVLSQSTEMVKSFSSDTELNSSKLPVLPQYILTALYDRRIPEDIVNEIHENPYLVESLTRRFSKFEDFARWMGKWGVRDGSDIGRMLVVKPKLLKAKLVAMDETVTVYRKELQIPDDQVMLHHCIML